MGKMVNKYLQYSLPLYCTKCQIYYLPKSKSKRVYPAKNVTEICSCLFDGSLVWFENETKSDGNSVIFLANLIKIPWLGLVHNSSHVLAWKTNKTFINYMEKSWNLVWIWTKLPSIYCDMKWHGISMRIHVTFFTGKLNLQHLTIIFRIIQNN